MHSFSDRTSHQVLVLDIGLKPLVGLSLRESSSPLRGLISLPTTNGICSLALRGSFVRSRDSFSESVIAVLWISGYGSACAHGAVQCWGDGAQLLAMAGVNWFGGLSLASMWQDSAVSDAWS
jgi:hypothetical protein